MNRRRNRNRVNMEVVMGVVGIIFVVILFAIFSKPKDSFYDKLQGAEQRVSYYEVNVRTKPTISAEVVYKLYLGEYVTLTGNVKEYPMDEVCSVWVQLEDGNWVISDAVISQAEYERKFGSY